MVRGRGIRRRGEWAANAAAGGGGGAGGKEGGRSQGEYRAADEYTEGEMNMASLSAVNGKVIFWLSIVVDSSLMLMDTYINSHHYLYFGRRLVGSSVAILISQASAVARLSPAYDMTSTTSTETQHCNHAMPPLKSKWFSNQRKSSNFW